MDPDWLLKRIRELIKDGDSADVVDAFEDLDEWLSKGGFLPKDWAIDAVQIEGGRR